MTYALWFVTAFYTEVINTVLKIIWNDEREKREKKKYRYPNGNLWYLDQRLMKEKDAEQRWKNWMDTGWIKWKGNLILESHKRGNWFSDHTKKEIDSQITQKRELILRSHKRDKNIQKTGISYQTRKKESLKRIHNYLYRYTYFTT